MRFAQPVWLASLALILLLLLARYRRVRLPVANLFLWTDNRGEEATPLTRRFRRHRLLVLQAAFLALVALALATPLATSRIGQVAIIVDVSMSMAAREDSDSRLERARAEIGKLLDTLPASAAVQLVAASVVPSTIGTFPAGSTDLTAALAALAATDGTANVDAAVQSAFATAPSPERIYVFSDSEPPAGLPHAVTWSNVGRSVNNMAVTTLSSRTPVAGGATQVLATIANFGDAPVQTVVALTVNGTSAGEQSLSISAGGSTRASFAVPDAQGIATVRLQHADALAADNVRMALLNRPPPIRVRVVNASATSYFVEKALTANTAVEVIREPDAESDVVVCLGCDEPPQGSEGVLLFTPSQPEGNPAPLVRTDGEHRVAADLVLDGVLAQPLRAPEPTPNSTIIARAGERAAIIAYETASQRVVEVRLDPSAEPLALSSAFPILIANAIEWLAEPGRDRSAAIAGEPLRIVSRTAAAPASVAGPDGHRVRAVLQNGVVTVPSANAAGVYRFEGRELVVNPATAAESDLRLRTAPPVRSAQAGNEAAGSSTSDASPLDLTAPVLAAALLLLALEWHYRTA